MAKNPILPLYYNDITRSTITWTDEEFGAYMRLLIEQWDKGGLPKDCQRLARLVTSFDTNWDFLKPKFVEVDGLLKNPTMEEIRDKARRHSEKQKENAQKRYQKPAKQDAKKLPLENEIENEIVIENKDRKEGVEEREGIIYPYNSETFKVNWLAWRTLLRDKHNKDYFNLTAEQSGLMGLSKLAKTETEAIEILQQSLRNGWKDLFKLKIENNGKQPTDYGKLKADSADRMATIIRKNHGSGNQQPVEGDSGA